MAVLYDKDLTLIADADSVGGSTTLTSVGTSTPAAPDTDFVIQSTKSYPCRVSGAPATGGEVYQNGSPITPGADTHFFFWIYCTAPGNLQTLQNAGMCAVMGTATTAYAAFHVQGNDTYATGGWRCYPVRYVNTANAVGPNYRTLVGSPGANPQYFGARLTVTATNKTGNNNLAVDAMYYGTGLYITGGDGGAGGTATFAGAAAVNDASAARYGILAAQPGGFALQGRFVIGQNASKVATACYFVDSDRLITLTDTPHALSTFTQIIVDHASTVLTLTNITVLSLGTINPGQLVFNNASTVATLTGCVFDSIGATTLRGAVSAYSCTWRRAGQVTQNGALLSGCQFFKLPGTAALLCNDPGRVSNCTFTSSGTGHAMQITAAGTYGFGANAFSGYAASNGSTGNEAVYNNSGGAVTLNITGGGSIPSVRNGAGASTTINVSNALTVSNIAAGSEARIFDASSGNELCGVETIGTSTPSNCTVLGPDSNGRYSITFSHTLDNTAVWITVVDTASYQVYRQSFTIMASAQSLLVSQVKERNFFNP